MTAMITVGRHGEVMIFQTGVDLVTDVTTSSYQEGETIKMAVMTVEESVVILDDVVTVAHLVVVMTLAQVLMTEVVVVASRRAVDRING